MSKTTQEEADNEALKVIEALINDKYEYCHEQDCEVADNTKYGMRGFTGHGVDVANYCFYFFEYNDGENTWFDLETEDPNHPMWHIPKALKGSKHITKIICLLNCIYMPTDWDAYWELMVENTEEGYEWLDEDFYE